MSHSVELIQRILELIQADYPSSQYKFTIEKAIPGTRMHPDILVCDADGKAHCVVEIGYTRPEKLTAYRDELKIPDVRWYDKAGKLHADVQEKVVRVAIEVAPSGMFVAYRISDMVECHSEICEQGAEAEWEAEFETEEDAADPEREEEKVHWVSDYLVIATDLFVVTNYNLVWFALYCDKCGECDWVPPDYSLDVEAVAYELEDLTAREFARNWAGRVMQTDWTGAVEYMKTQLNLDLRYEEGDFLSDEERERVDRALSAVRLEAMTN